MLESTPESLGQSDTYYWLPRQQILNYVCSQIPTHGLVLEVGSGRRHFERANIHIDMVPSPDVPKERMILCDICKEELPFPDKRFDFVYCRQTLEDLYDPFFVMDEMSRVAKAGYIETPSPMAEMCRGVDPSTPKARGYNHHRWLIWSNDGRLCFVTKYPLIELFGLDDSLLVHFLREGPRYWNTSFLWKNKINWRHIQDEAEFNMPHDYPKIVEVAAGSSVVSIDKFYDNMEKVENAA